MISNSKWLNSLSSDELTEWLNAEHKPSVKKGLKITFADGGIVEGHPLVDERDSRAKIEADIDTWLGSWTAFSVPLKMVKQAVLGWLNRQAEITEREVKLRELYRFEENHREHIRSIEEVNKKLNQRIAELEAQVGESQVVTRAHGRSTNQPELSDTRDELLADIRKHYAYTMRTLMYPDSANKSTDMLASLPVDTVIGWLDRQAAITRRAEREESGWMFDFLTDIGRKCGTKDCPSLVAYVEQLEARVEKLEATNEELEAECNELSDELLTCKHECENYRMGLGKAFDHAHGILSIDDFDEGLA